MKRIGEFLASDLFVRLRARARQHARLHQALVAALPEWIEAEGVEVDLDADGILLVSAPMAQARTLSQLLPSVVSRLTDYGVRSVRLEKRV